MCKNTPRQINNHNIPKNSETATSWNWTSDVKGTWKMTFYLQYAGNTQRTLVVGSKNYWVGTQIGSSDVCQWENVTVNVWDTVKVTWSGFSSIVSTYCRISYSEYLNVKNCKVYELKEIWEKITGYLFGKLPDGTRRDGN